MPMPPVDPELKSLLDRQEQRLTALESHSMHLQRDFDTINQVVLEQGRKLDQIMELLNRLTRQVEVVRANAPQPPEEKPPHY